MSFQRQLALGLFVASSVTLGIGGCSSSATPKEPLSALDNALIEQDFDTTVKELSALPWLPWTYLTDGCYARALYYSMLLASKNVPTNHLYAVAKPGTTLMGIWSWHVAPLVTKDGDKDHLYVLDPAYDQTKALTNVEWGAKELWPDPTDPKYPTFHVHQGNSYLAEANVVDVVQNPGDPVAANYKEPAFADMPQFKMSNVLSACSTMHAYIDRETTTDADGKAAKHVALGQETQRIVAALVPLNLISGTVAFPATCTRQAPDAAPPPPPPPSDDGGTSSGGSASGGVDPTAADFVDPTRIPVDL